MIDGDVANTKAPVPVSSVTADAKFADDGVAKNVATFAPKPDTPEEIGRPVQLVRVPEVGVPNNGVVRVGDVANTKSPVPVSSVIADNKLAEDGVAKNVATLAAKPDTPEEIGRPVQLVRVPEVGVPNNGVVRVGDVANTKRPVPVSSDITPANSEEEVAANTLSLLPVVVKVPAVGNVTLEAAVVVSVNAKAPTVASVELSAKVKVAAVAGAVKATLLILVAVATPKTGVIRVGVLANTFTPVPVLSVSADAKLAEDGVAKNVATLAPKPDTPDEIGSPVQLVRVPEVGVPSNGVVRVGEVANTKSPVPVSSDITPANSEEDVAAKTLSLLPVVVNVPAVGNVTLVAAVVVSVKLKAPTVASVELSANVNVAAVAGAVNATLFILVAVATPKTGVIRVGVLANTFTPVPVLSVSADAKLAEDGVAKNVATLAPKPDTPDEIGRPVQLVKVPEVGVPNNGVVRVGDVANTKSPVPVSSVTADAKLAEDGVAKKVATPVAKPDTPDEIGKPVQLVRVPEVGVPNNGVVRVGDVANTKSPVPVSSDITPANSDDVVAAWIDNLLPLVISVPAVGNVTLVTSVALSVKPKAPTVVRVELFANVSVAAAAGAVTVILLNFVENKLSAEGIYFSVASEDTATPEPPFVLENKMK